MIDENVYDTSLLKLNQSVEESSIYISPIANIDLWLLYSVLSLSCKESYVYISVSLNMHNLVRKLVCLMSCPGKHLLPVCVLRLADGVIIWKEV